MRRNEQIGALPAAAFALASCRFTGRTDMHAPLINKSKRQPDSPTSASAPRTAAVDSGRFGGRHRLPLFLQAKLSMSAANDAYEEEADRVADEVTRMSQPNVQRACSCGGGCPKCQGKQSGQNTRETVQRKPVAADAITEVPELVDEVLHTAGETLTPGARTFFEPRFGHDFGALRVHTGAKAAESAAAINALAYTVGSHIVFGHGQYHPHSARGQRLLAHEMTHVIQQGGADAGSTGLGSTLRVQRTVGSTNCASGRRGAPADPTAELTAADARASGLAQAAAILTQVASASASMGIDILNHSVGVAFQARFGLPPAVVRGGFQNRFTGAIRSTRDEALSEELGRLADRLQSISDLYAGAVTYRCIAGTTTFANCEAHCRNRDASACEDIRVVFLCPSFWQLSEAARAALLIHEGGHVRFGNPAHSVAGRRANFRHPECMASYVSDLFGLPTGTPACPAP